VSLKVQKTGICAAITEKSRGPRRSRARIDLAGLQSTLYLPAHTPYPTYVWSTVMNTIRRCIACGCAFQPCPQVLGQRFCSAPACQRERRRRWQRERLRDDADYRDNQTRAQAKWRARHPDYWRQYRATHPAYRERNCAMQRKRNAQRSSSPVANMDASSPLRPLASGFYILRRAVETGIAKMNACTVHIAVLSVPNGPPIRDCKEMT
jgi:hypothetical protein